MKIESLDWDSKFFGFKIGRITITKESDFDYKNFKELAVKGEYELIYVFKLQKLFSGNIVQKAGLDLVDIQLTMLKKFIKEDYLAIPYSFKNDLTEQEKFDCYEIAEATSVVSRFAKEKNIGSSLTKELYRKWIDNTLNKSFSDGLFIEQESNKISGIHLIKTDEKSKTGYFTLTGVSPNYKRMGIGKKLWMQSLAYWANETEVELIKSPFSFQNLESLNFHLKMGFSEVVERKFIYHFRNTIKS